MTTLARRRKRIRIRTDWEPHSVAQAAILEAPEQILDVTCGRRFGKSALARAWLTGIWEGARDGAILVPHSRNWYCAPQRQPNCTDFYDGLKRSLGALVVDKSDVDLYLRLLNGATIECKSLERPDNLRGAGLDRLVIDEKGTCPRVAWDEVLAPMVLADPPDKELPDGSPCLRRVLRLGTPRGRKHWTFGEHMASLQGQRGPGGRNAFQFPTWARPGTERYVDEARKTLPANVFRQELGAEFLEDAASYFQRIVYDGAPPPAVPEASAVYTAGVDLAHADDWTVVVVVRAKPRPMRVVHVERFSRAPWATTKARIVAVLSRWNADALLDATPGGAPGEVTVEAFSPEWRRIEGFDSRTQQGAGREDMLANLAISLEQEELLLPGTSDAPAFPVLAAELSGFSYEVMPSGRARACAGPNLHDDTVYSLGLATWKAKRARNPYGSRKTL